MTPATGGSQRRVLATIFTIVFIDLLGFSILIPVLPLYAEHFGADQFVGSLLLAVYSLFQFIGAPILGRLSDERGRRPILLISLFGSMVSWLLFAFAGNLSSLLGVTSGLAILFVARSLAGVMGGNIATANAYIADITSEEDRAKGLGLLGAAFGFGFVFGPAIAGVVSTPSALSVFRGVLPSVVPVTQFTMPSLVAAVLSAINLVAAFFILPEPEHREKSVETDGESRLRQLYEAATDPAIGSLMIAFFIGSFAFSAFENESIFLLNDRLGYGTTSSAVLLTYIGILIVIFQGMLIGPLTERFGEYRLALAGAVLQGVALVLVPFSVSWNFLPSIGPIGSGAVGFALMATPLSLGYAFTNVSLPALVSLNTDADTQGEAMGVTQSAASLARTLGPAVAGMLYVAIAYWSPFVVAGILFVPMIAFLRRMAQDRVELRTAAVPADD